MEKDINNMLTDEQLDDLIQQSFARQQTIDEINVAVMGQLRQATRRRRLLQWGRMVVFAFGLPLLLFLFGWLLWMSVSQQEAPQFSLFHFQVPVFVCLLFPIGAMLYASWRAIENFSLSDV